MSRVFERIAVLGLGLLGGSVAAAARQRGVARHAVGYARRRGPLEWALASGLIDEVADLETAVSGADLVVLATPVGAMESLLAEAAPHLSPDALVTDVGSVKGVLADRLPGQLPASVHYIGAHPMAGSHECGVEFASANLFEGSRCVISPVRSTPDDAVAAVSDFWRGLGCDVVLRDPGEHDVEVAWVSHAPHALAFAFAHSLGAAPSTATELAGSGFRDFVRIARSDPSMWAEILNSNRKALASPLRAFAESMETLARSVEDGDLEKLEAFLAQARSSLEEGMRNVSAQAKTDPCEDVRSGGENPEIQAEPKSAAQGVTKTTNE
ncbi:MAG: prephenate dehydrogenase [Myxococcota bacterium]|nr:prephenate dehydrogenase [Myxococcota bacterium]